MLAAGANGWDAVIAIAQLVGTVAVALLAYLNRRRLKVPSGGTIGVRMERVHELVATLVKAEHGVDGPVQSNGVDAHDLTP